MPQLPALEKTKFELEVEKQERKRYIFDMRKYKAKHNTFASGIHKSIARLFGGKKSSQQQAAMNVYVSVNHHYNNNKELKGSAFKNNFDNSSTEVFLMSQELFKSRSQVPMQQRRRNNQGVGTVIEVLTHGDDLAAATNQNIDGLLEPSDVDLEIEDENKNFFMEENFSGGTENSIGLCPFQHWSVYRQQMMQVLQQRHFNRAAHSMTHHKELYKEMVSKLLHKDLFYQWLVRFSPMMYQSGQQWSNAIIREFIFCQNQQMVNSSSSSVVMSHHNLSHHSMSQRSSSGLSLGGSSNLPTSQKEKKIVHLGSYSQILGKEVGGISKQDMHGVLYTMGTDAYGQLG